MKRAWLILLLVLLPGCSGTKMFYDQLDQLAPQYLEKYVPLTTEQEILLAREIAELRRWHCGTQLAAYAGWLRAVSADVQAGDVTYAGVERHYASLQGFWKELMRQMSPGAAELLLTMSDAQVDQLFRRLEQDNDKLEAERRKPSAAGQRRKSAGMMERQLTRWVGVLSPSQREAVAAWSARLAPDQGESGAARRSWQAQLRRLLQQRADTRAFRAGVRTLLAQPEQYWPPGYRRVSAANREQTLRLFADIGASLTPEQREYFARRAASWARDFDQIACSGFVPRPAHEPGVPSQRPAVAP